MSSVSFTLNGTTLQVEKGRTILEAAQAHGVNIPTLCYDPRLKPSGQCRLCLVEVDGVARPVPACYTTVADGMVVATETEGLTSIRKTLVELILSDVSGGFDLGNGTELAAIARRLGVSKSRYYREPDRAASIGDYNKNPFIQFDPDICISCGRCIRICAEVQMDYAIEFAERGFNTRVATPLNRSLLDSSCVLCGQCISTCPTGALIEKKVAHLGVGREFERVRTTCPYCGTGCQMDLNVHEGSIVKITAPVGVIPNDGNLCVKGRFAYDYIHAPDRLRNPLIKRNGRFEEASWDEALEGAARGLASIKERYGPDAIGFVSSSRCTNEETYLFQKLARAGFGTNNVDCCSRT